MCAIYHSYNVIPLSKHIIPLSTQLRDLACWQHFDWCYLLRGDCTFYGIEFGALPCRCIFFIWRRVWHQNCSRQERSSRVYIYTYVGAYRPSIKGSKLLFPVIKATKIKTHGYLTYTGLIFPDHKKGLVSNTHHGKKHLLKTCTHDRMIGRKVAKPLNPGDTAKKTTFLDETNHAAVSLTPKEDD